VDSFTHAHEHTHTKALYFIKLNIIRSLKIFDDIKEQNGKYNFVDLDADGKFSICANMNVNEIDFDIMYVICLCRDRAHYRISLRTTIKLETFRFNEKL
jgi:hypothetical protein